MSVVQMKCGRDLNRGIDSFARLRYTLLGGVVLAKKGMSRMLAR